MIADSACGLASEFIVNDHLYQIEMVMKKYIALLVGLLTFGHMPGRAERAERNGVIRLYELTLPEFKLENSSFAAGLQIIRDAWTQKHPDQSFPVIIVAGVETHASSAAKVSMDLKQIPALEAVNYLAQACGMALKHGFDLIVLSPQTILDESAWETRALLISDRVTSIFGLKDGSEGDAVNAALKKRLEEYGLTFEGGFEVRWYGGGQIIIRNTPEEINKLRGLMMLFDAGYTVQKPRQK